MSVGCVGTSCKACTDAWEAFCSSFNFTARAKESTDDLRSSKGLFSFSFCVASASKAASSASFKSVGFIMMTVAAISGLSPCKNICILCASSRIFSIASLSTSLVL